MRKHAFSTRRQAETAETLRGLVIRFDPNLLIRDRRATLHRSDCAFVSRHGQDSGISHHASFRNVTVATLASLVDRGYRIGRHKCCSIKGPGNYIPDAQRRTERITLRLPPVVAEKLREMAESRECTLAAVVEFMVKACLKEAGAE